MGLWSKDLRVQDFVAYEAKQSYSSSSLSTRLQARAGICVCLKLLRTLQLSK